MKEHIPVLLAESVGFLAIKPGGIYADLTLGLGGHSREILKALGPGGLLVGFDKDDDAIAAARENIGGSEDRLRIIKSDFRDAPLLLREAGIPALDGFLMDLGVSTMQIKTAERGFGFSSDAPLDMRMDRSSGQTAAELLRDSSEEALADIIYRYGEERWSRAIARRLQIRNLENPVTTTRELAEEVKRAIPARFWPPKTHPATRTFQALRIAVNDELGALSSALTEMVGLLNSGGRAVVLSYHSLEDRIVKKTFNEFARGCDCPPDFPVCVCGKKPVLKVLTGRPVTASEKETRDNPSARSAKLRAAEKL